MIDPSLLNQPVKIFVCRDRTLSYGDKPFNGVAIPVFSVADTTEAEALIALVGSVQYEEHPLLPGQKWRKITLGTLHLLELKNLPDVQNKLHSCYRIITSRKAA